VGNIWLASAVWIGLALAASAMQNWVAVSIALLEIIIGAFAGNIITLSLTPWVNYLAGLGAILLTFLAGAEIDINVVRRHFASTLTIGAVGFFAPYLGVLAFLHTSCRVGRGLRPRSLALPCQRLRSPSSTQSWSRPASMRRRSAKSS
jgi:Kef-type K+ transport system membrane component KefB